MRPTVLDGPGAVHIDRVVSDCLRQRQCTEDVALRLEVAVIAADILDGVFK